MSSVAAQEEGVAGRSSQTVAEPTDPRSVFHRTPLTHIALMERERERRFRTHQGEVSQNELFSHLHQVVDSGLKPEVILKPSV